ncbi:autotransporter-associated beta strand repeat-containing protein [Desulfovibrio sp. OttesenSCG-928-M16]|nr:autotransporter-associated beta strand repeat-containing protein [Desulfovibrio sp. OttesenSCG-928-M16]
MRRFFHWPRPGRTVLCLLALFFSLPVAPAHGEDIVYPKDPNLVTDGYYWVKGNQGVWETHVPFFVEYLPLSLNLATMHNTRTAPNWIRLAYERLPVSLLQPWDADESIWVKGYVPLYEEAHKKGRPVVFGAPLGSSDRSYLHPRTDVRLDGAANVGSMRIDTSALPGGKSWTFTSGSITSSFDEFKVGGSTSSLSHTTTFQNVILQKFGTLAIHDHDTLKFENSSLINILQINLYDNAALVWDAKNVSHLDSLNITGHSSGARLDLLNLAPAGISVVSISGYSHTNRLSVHISGQGSPRIDTSRYTDIYIDAGDIDLNDVLFQDVSLILAEDVRMSFSGAHTYSLNRLTLEDGSELVAGGRIQFTENDSSLNGAGRITVAAPDKPLTLSPNDQYKGSWKFCGSIDLNGSQLSVADGRIIGNPERIFSSSNKHRGVLHLYGDSPLLTPYVSIQTALGNGSDSLEIFLDSQQQLSISQPAGEISHGLELRKSGGNTLVLDGGLYQFDTFSVDKGKLGLTGGVTLTPKASPFSTLSVSRDGDLHVAGPARLAGVLTVDEGTFSLAGALTVTGDAGVFAGPFDYQGGRLSVTGDLQLQGSMFSAHLPHPGVFVVADYGALSSRFANAPLDSQDVSSLVLIHDSASRAARLIYAPGNRILLEAGGYDTLYRTGGTGGEQERWNDTNPYGVPNYWQNRVGEESRWTNNISRVAVFGALGVTPYDVKLDGTIRVPMLSFLDGGWSVSCLKTWSYEGPDGDLLMLSPLVDDPDSPLHVGVLNSQVISGAAPRLNIPVLMYDSSYERGADVPLWKTGPGDLILAGDGTLRYEGRQGPIDQLRPTRVFIKGGRLILEHNATLPDALITVEPDTALALDWQTAGTGNNLRNTLSGSGSLEVRADTNISGANPDFSGPVEVSDATDLALYDRAALGKGTGLAGIELGQDARLRLAYTDATTPLPRSVRGKGGLTVEAGQTIRLAADSSYTGGTAIGGGAALIMEGPGAERDFTAAGSGTISFDNAGAALRLEGGGILGNRLEGNTQAVLQLAGPHIYTLEENTASPGRIQDKFSGTAKTEHRFTELVLKADSALTGDIRPTFGISGPGNLILHGSGRVFDFTGLTGNTYTGGTVLAKETALKLDGDYTSGRIGAGRILLRHESALLLEMAGGGNFANALVGTGTLQLSDAQYRLTGDNSLFGGGIVIPGTLEVHAQQDVGRARLILEGAATVRTDVPSLENGMELASGIGTLDILQDLRLSGAITGNGGLNKNGAGTLTLTHPDNGYDGTTRVNAGTLRLEGAGLNGFGAVTVGSGAALSGWGRVVGDTSIADNAEFSVDGLWEFYGRRDDDGKLLSGTNLSLNVGSRLVFNHGGNLDVSGALEWGQNANGSDINTTVNLDSLGVTVLAHYGSSNLASGLMLNANHTVMYNNGVISNDPRYRVELENVSAAGDLVLIAIPTGQTLKFWAKSDGGLWNVNGERNWHSKYLASPATQVWTVDSRVAVFGSAGVASSAVRLDGNIAASGLFFLTDDWSLTGGSLELVDLDPFDVGGNYAVIGGQGSALINSALSGAAGLHKSGSGAIVLSSPNSYRGGTLVSAGTLDLWNRLSASSGNITIEQPGTLKLAYHDLSQGFMNSIEGAGRLTVAGQVLLDRANPFFNGETLLTAGGVLRLAHDNALGGSTLRLAYGTLQLADGLTLGNQVELLSVYANLEVAAGKSAAISGSLGGSGGFTKTGAGQLVLTNDNSAYSGVTSLVDGTLVTGADMALGKGDVRIYAGGTIGFSGNRNLQNAFSLYGESFFDVATGNDSTLSGSIDGPGGLTKTGTGSLTLDSNNSYTGFTTVQQGTLALAPGVGISEYLKLQQNTVFNSGGNDLRLAQLDVSLESASSQPAKYLGALDISGGQAHFSTPGDADFLSGLTILNVDGAANIDGTRVGITLGGRPENLRPYQKLTLIHSRGLTGTPANTELSGRRGITLAWKAGLTWDEDNLYASITYVGASPESKALSEGFLAGMALVNQGADIVAGPGMDAARRAAWTAPEQDWGLAAFGTVSSGKVRYNTGSYVDMRSISVLTGLTLASDTRAGRLTSAAFFEYGNGSYDTHNSFSNAASVDGEGHTHYMGGGVFCRIDFKDTGPGHIYTEASARAGRVHNDYDSSDLRDSNGRKADYESSTNYYGLHLGTGYVWNVTDKASFDLYAKYFWTRQEGHGVSLPTGETVRFDDVDSHRVRMGSRFGYTVNEHVSSYIGTAWEYEFDGKARASTYGYPIDAPDLKGSTCIGELGLSIKPSTELPLTFDLGLQGYTGKREGVTGSLQIKFEF